MKTQLWRKLCLLLTGTFMLVFVVDGFFAPHITLAAENDPPPEVVLSAGGNTIGGPGVSTGIPGEFITIFF
jgi:hypothetical protein